jgi:hypothetical protein
MHMPLRRHSSHDDQLTGYLLGSLPAHEVERLDEQSIVDDDLAARLRLVEDDLVDAYASGALTGDTLARFESFYLASPRRREKAAFAKRFLAVVDGASDRQRAEPLVPAGRGGVAGRWFLWSLAAAAVLLLATGALLVQDVRLRRDLNNAERQVAAADQRTSTVSGQLDEQQKTAATAKQALADARRAEPRAESLATVALVLLPQTRGVGPVPIVAVQPGSRTVPLELRIEAAGLAPYDVALRDPATNRIVWRSSPLTPQRLRRPPAVPVGVPTGLLKPQHYALDLFRLQPGNPPEFVGTYAFEVVRP